MPRTIFSSGSEKNFAASLSICASSVMSTTSRALSARPGRSIVTFCACIGAVTEKIRRARRYFRMSFLDSMIGKLVDVFARVAQFFAGDAEREQHLLFRPFAFAPLLDPVRGRAAEDGREQRGRGELAPDVTGARAGG